MSLIYYYYITFMDTIRLIKKCKLKEILRRIQVNAVHHHEHPFLLEMETVFFDGEPVSNLNVVIDDDGILKVGKFYYKIEFL